MSILPYVQMVADAERRLRAATQALVADYDDWQASGGDCFELKRAVKGLRISRAKTRHGEASSATVTSEYRIWRGMMARCLNVKNTAWVDYGGRGITVCNRWLTYENFLADMGRKPSPEHSLDRRNNDLGYSPDNCRWSTKKVQARNRRSSTAIEFKGEVKTIAEWAEVTGMTVSTITQRIRAKWPIELTLTAPQRANPRKPS